MSASQDGASIPGLGRPKFQVFRDRVGDVTSSAGHPESLNLPIPAGVVKPRVSRDRVLQDAGNRQLGAIEQVEKDELSRGNSVENGMFICLTCSYYVTSHPALGITSNICRLYGFLSTPISILARSEN